MKSSKLLKRIKSYALSSFLIPLIAINACLLIYKFFGNLDIITYPNFNWNKHEHTYTWNEYNLAVSNTELHTFTNCPKYIDATYYNYIDNQTLKTIKEIFKP